ncbi:glycosyl transferase group 1 [Nitrospira sp.]|nr:glycosyl transferase group 1 [Nitrospira sp.]
MSISVTPVLYVSHHADIVGGGEISLLHLAERLDRTRWCPLMVLPGQGAMAAECRRRDIATFILPMPTCRRFGKDMRASVTRLREIIRVTDASVLHANGSRAMMYAGIAGRLEGRRVVWHVRVAQPDGFIDRVLARLAHRIVVNSQAVAARFGFVSPNRLLCIYNGIDLDAYAPAVPHSADAVRRQLGVPLNVPMAMSIGRMTSEKGQGYLLEVAQRLAAAMPDLYWVLVGDGKERAVLETRCKEMGLDDRVRFPGWLTDIPAALAACDLFVLPSVSEGFGRVLVEAMAMRKAVVASRTGGVPEVVVPGETGILVPPANPDALARAVGALIANPQLAEYFGQNGRLRVEDRFTLSHHVQAVSGVYDALVA